MRELSIHQLADEYRVLHANAVAIAQLTTSNNAQIQHVVKVLRSRLNWLAKQNPDACRQNWKRIFDLLPRIQAIRLVNLVYQKGLRSARDFYEEVLAS